MTKAELENECQEAFQEIQSLRKKLQEAESWATRHVMLTDRLLNVLEWRAKEGNV